VGYGIKSVKFFAMISNGYDFQPVESEKITEPLIVKYLKN